MDKTNTSERKRLESVKHKKQIFKAKELAVQNALKNLDSKLNNNKIVFDDDIDKIEQSKVKKKEKKRKRDLFDDDDGDNKNDTESVWDANKFKINKNISGKFTGHNITVGNDERFKLDKRFMEDDQNSDKNIIENYNETDLQKEKELQLDILENILGVPIISKNKDLSKDVKSVQKGMIRYDPTEDGHKEYEINIEKSEPETKKVKKKNKNKDSTEDANQNPPLEVSRDIYFSVSNSLTERLKDGEEFSLLKTYGKEINDAKTDNNNDISTMEPLKPSKIQLAIDSKNPFKYDSSDNEYDNEYEYTNNEQHTNNTVMGHINKFFFDTNDIRFNEAKEFFSKRPVSEDTFKELRRELKQIMRAKIRKNMKKKQPWGYKQKIKNHRKKSV